MPTLTTRVTSVTSVLALAAISVASSCPPGTGSGTPPPAAATPVGVAPATTDPAPTAAPAGAPALYTSTLKFKIPTGTVFEVAEEGWLLPENTIANCGDDGCYSVLNRVDNGDGTTTYLIQTWPQSYKRFAEKLIYAVTDVSLNSGFTGANLASTPDTFIVTPGVSTTLGGQPLPFTVHGTPEWAAANEQQTLQFATIGLSTQADASAYYAATGAAADFATWRTNNGFAANDDSQDDAKAYYFNAGDLALGRSMHMKIKANGDIAYYVSNYPTVADAIRNTNLIASVAMEFSPIPPGTQRVMKFAVYKGSDGSRLLAADLDGNGAKFVPNLCVICHGQQKYVANGPVDLNARYLPFDLTNFQYDRTIGRNSQEAAFKQLNVGILDHGNPTAAESDLINSWYNDPTQAPPNHAAATQIDDAMPSTWGATTAETNLYQLVIRPSCRSCHISRGPGLDFRAFADIQSTVRGPDAANRICSNRAMPNAKVTYRRFWLTHLPQGKTPIDVLNSAGLHGWPFAGGCPQ